MPFPIGWQPSPVSSGFASTAPYSNSNISSAFRHLPTIFQWNSLRTNLDLSYLISHEEGLPSGGRRINSSIQTISAAAHLALGLHWSGDYTHSRTYFSNKELLATTDDAASIKGQYNSREWAWMVVASYTFDFRNLPDTGSQTRRKIYNLEGSGSTMLGTRTLLSTSAAFGGRSADVPNPSSSTLQIADIQTWSANQILSYKITDKLDIGPSANETYERMDPGDDAVSYTVSAQVNWKPSRRLVATGSIGQKYWRYRGAAERPTKTLVYNTTASYQLTPTTTFNAAAYQTFGPSYFSNQATDVEGWNLGLEQRLLKRFFLSVTGRKSRTTYSIPVGGVPFQRVDRADGIGASLATPLLTRGTLSVFYSKGRNLSSDSIFTFGDNLSYGIQFAIKF